MKEKGFKQQKLGETRGRHDGMKFNSTAEEKGNYTCRDKHETSNSCRKG